MEKEVSFPALDDLTRKRIEEIEARSKYRTGLGTIDRGECPRGYGHAVACASCPYGHILECHYPLSCKDAFCQHYQRELILMTDPRREDD